MRSSAESNTTCPLTIVHVDREGSNCLLEKRHCNVFECKFIKRFLEFKVFHNLDVNYFQRLACCKFIIVLFIFLFNTL